MKTFLKIILLVLISGLLIGCKTYRSIENVTVKNNPQFTKIENLNRQLDHISTNEKIQVRMKNGREFYLTYLYHSNDSLYATIENHSEFNRKEVSVSPIQVYLEDIDKLGVWRTNYVISVGIPSYLLLCGILFVTLFSPFF